MTDRNQAWPPSDPWSAAWELGDPGAQLGGLLVFGDNSQVTTLCHGRHGAFICVSLRRNWTVTTHWKKHLIIIWWWHDHALHLPITDWSHCNDSYGVISRFSHNIWAVTSAQVYLKWLLHSEEPRDRSVSACQNPSCYEIRYPWRIHCTIPYMLSIYCTWMCLKKYIYIYTCINVYIQKLYTVHIYILAHNCINYIYIYIYLHYIYITFTLHLHYIYITFTLHLHYIYITFTLHLHYIYIYLTLHQHHINITLTSHWHHIDITLTSHWHHINITLTSHHITSPHIHT